VQSDAWQVPPQGIAPQHIVAPAGGDDGQLVLAPSVSGAAASPASTPPSTLASMPASTAVLGASADASTETKLTSGTPQP
jgi:hypothetical protein